MKLARTLGTGGMTEWWFTKVVSFLTFSKAIIQGIAHLYNARAVKVVSIIKRSSCRGQKILNNTFAGLARCGSQIRVCSRAW